MSRIYGQATQEVFRITGGSFTANGASSGSLVCLGYKQLVGFFRTDKATETASGLMIRQSFDGGENWDYVSASDAITANGSAACIVDIIGDAIRIDVSMGASEGSGVRCGFWLRPF